MNVSTLAYCRLFILAKIVATKMRATGMNFLTFSFSSGSHSIFPMAEKALTTRAVPISWAKRMKDGAATLWTAYLLAIRRVAEQIM